MKMLVIAGGMVAASVVAWKNHVSWRSIRPLWQSIGIMHDIRRFRSPDTTHWMDGLGTLLT